MSSPFIITGLPRSRTAWLSAFINTPNVQCHHEPLKFMSNISELKGRLESDSLKYIGASDSGIGFFLPEVNDLLDNPPIVIIDRNIDDVRRSLRRLGFEMGSTLDTLKSNLLEHKGDSNVMWVPFSALDDLKTVEKMWFHLVPGEPFDEERYNLFNYLKIEVDMAKLWSIFKSHKQSQWELMREKITGGKSCLG